MSNIYSKSLVFNDTYHVLGQGLNISARKQNLISSNIANVDTVGYKPKDLNFQDALKKALADPPKAEIKVSNSKHFNGLEDYNNDPLKNYREDDSDEYHLDSVDIDKEMTKLAENNLKYKTMTEMLLRKMSMLKYSIAEGGK